MERSRRIVLQYIKEVWNEGNFDSLKTLTTSDFSYLLASLPAIDREGMGIFLNSMRIAFPDWKVEPAEVVEEAGMVAVRWTGRATHLGPFHGIPPTKRSITVGGMNLYLLEQGLIKREWEQMDTLGMLRQMGAIPG